MPRFRRAQARFRLDDVCLESFLARIQRGGIQLGQLLVPLDPISLADEQFHNESFHLGCHVGSAQGLDTPGQLETGSERVRHRFRELDGRSGASAAGRGLRKQETWGSGKHQRGREPFRCEHESA